MLPCLAACARGGGDVTDVTDTADANESAAATETEVPDVDDGPREFVHPGLLHTKETLERTADAIASGDREISKSFELLRKSEFCAVASPRAAATINRGGNGDNCAVLYRDMARAYQCAIYWRLTGDTKFGDCARDILNAWSATLKNVGGNADRYLASGLYGYQLANAAELMRDYPGFELERMQDMLINVFYKPLCERFLVSNEFGADHNDACITNYWANWDLANMAATIAIGVFCDRRDIYDTGVRYFMYGLGNGSVYNAIPFLYEDEELAQWQESGRDQGHATLGIGLMVSCCEMAYSQGDDLYGWAGQRFYYAAEYVARYNNGDDVPFSRYEWASGQRGDWQSQTVISDASRGHTRPIWAMIYNHYHNRLGLEAPNIARALERQPCEGGPGGHASTFDQTGFGTLLYNDPEGSGVNAALPGGEVADGVYIIACGDGSGVLTSSGGGAVSVAAADGSDAQRWRVTHAGGGMYTVVNVGTGLTLGVRNGSYVSNTRIVVGADDGEAWQRFVFAPAKAEGKYRIFAAHASLAVTSLKDGVAHRRYEGVSSQMWELVEAQGE